MQNIDEHRRTNTGNEISVYDVVVDSGIHNDGIYDESLPSSVHNNNNGRLSGITSAVEDAESVLVRPL